MTSSGETTIKRARGAIVLAIALMCAVVAVWLVARAGGPGLNHTAIDQYRLVTADGRPFDRKELIGSPSVMYFGFTRCPDMCPMMISRLIAARRTLGGDAADVPIIFVTIDPEYDTPARLKTFVSTFDAPVIALTGTPEAIDRAADKAAVFVKHVKLPNGEDTIEHTTSAFVYDRDGDFVDAVLPGDSQQAILDRLRRVIAQPQATASGVI
ncbi:protein SCO1/2 [Novosphingobium hassiacum]|uniref:Protein SCO1/2 n=1 Tax=Novosphingobium hassiacum TaxID=173676 RepID=A0A7W5ZXG7_9SPHN|nr:SCO family protein [Novosphingobium hassiacum]MBB3861758.1 protein SCO1/2 [Novosphingobium hassiacum]